MSLVFDALQQAIETLEGDVEIKAQARFVVDALHDYSHANTDVLNHDATIRTRATILYEILNRATIKQEDSDGG